MTDIHLFVQEGCRPCMYAETQLNKVEGWENVVTITNAKEGNQWTQFATDCGVVATPTLVALIDGVECKHSFECPGPEWQSGRIYKRKEVTDFGYV